MNYILAATIATVILPNGKIQQRIYIPTNGKIIEQRVNENLEVTTTLLMPINKNTVMKIRLGEPKINSKDRK